MRKYFLIIGLFLTVTLSGQLPGVVASQAAVSAAVSEMITNGEFATTDNWSIVNGDGNVTGAISGGNFNATYTAGSTVYLKQLNAEMAGTIAINTAYKLTFDLTRNATVYLIVRSSSLQTYVAEIEYTTNGTKTINFTTPGDVGDAGIRFSLQTLGAATVTVDNISLKLDL